MRKEHRRPKPIDSPPPADPAPRRPVPPPGAQEAWSWKLEPPGPALGDYFTGPQRP